MNKKVLLIALIGALYCGGGLGRADETITKDKDAPVTIKSLAEDIKSSPEDALSALTKAESKVLYSSLLSGLQDNSRKEDMSFAEIIPSAYREIIKNPATVDTVVSGNLQTYYGKSGIGMRNVPNTLGFIQMSQAANEFQAQMSLIQYAQNQRLIDQNNEIIDLLKQLVAKK